MRVSFLSTLASVAAFAVLTAALPAQNHAAPKKHIYPDPAKAKSEIQAALVKAKKEHKRIILDFGGNWCGDCIVLDKYFHSEPNASLLKKNFVLVDINIGRWDANKDLAKTYEVPLEKGVPALAVLDEDGKILYSQRNGEFEAMRTLSPAALTEFLTRWKP